MGSTTTTVISFTMIALFSIAIMGFSISFAVDNDAAFSIADSEEVSSAYYSQDGNLTHFIGNSTDTYTSILQSTVEPGSDVVPSAAPFALTSGSLIGTANNMIRIPVVYIFGGPGSPFKIFFSTLIGLMIVLSGFYLYKTLRGNP